MISIVTINYNGSKDTIELIESLRKSDESYHLIVVDNKSPNEDDIVHLIGYVKKLCDSCHVMEYSSPFVEETTQYTINTNEIITIIRSNSNYGFAKGTNIGLNYSIKMFPEEPYIAILNNDTIVTKHFISSITSQMTANELDACMGTILYYGYDEPYIWSIGGPINWIRGEGIHLQKNNIYKPINEKFVKREFVSGCFTIFRQDSIKKIGLLDEDYFFAGEEYQYSYDLTRRGYKLAWIPASVIYHKSTLDTGNGSSHTISDLPWQYNAYMVKIVFVNKNRGLLFRSFWHLLFRLHILVRVKKKYLSENSFGPTKYNILKSSLFENIKKKCFTYSDFIDFKERILVDKQ